jgi:hypothetical protein
VTGDGAGTDGLRPGRHRAVPLAREVVTHRAIRRLALALVVVGVVTASAGAAAAVILATNPPPTRSVLRSAPDDPHAGDNLSSLVSTTPGKGPGDVAPRVPLAAGDSRAAVATAIHIPRLRVDRRLVMLRMQRDRRLGVPRDYDDVGWWSGGPRPGGPGAALFAGHVSSTSGPAVFFDLKKLRRGDLVTVDRRDRTSAVFKVVGRASYPRRAFPDEVVYRTAGKSSIHLVTCDGAFDRAIGHHLDNLVVFADLISTGPTTRGSS